MTSYNMSYRTKYYQKEFQASDFTDGEKLSLVLRNLNTKDKDDSYFNAVKMDTVKSHYESMFPESTFSWQCDDETYCKPKFDGVCTSYGTKTGCKDINLDDLMITDLGGACNLYDKESKNVYYYICGGGYSSSSYDEFTYDAKDDEIIVNQKIIFFSLLDSQNITVYKNLDFKEENLLNLELKI